ncbi:hypothetical protein P7K49_031331, partial [Saguinus oedipus]
STASIVITMTSPTFAGRAGWRHRCGTVRGTAEVTIMDGVSQGVQPQEDTQPGPDKPVGHPQQSRSIRYAM